MLSKEVNELLCRVGPGTPMGETLRRYWLPACLSAELPEPDGAPARVKLLGESLVAFRDTSGRIGLVDDFCPHRGASLWLGRNEAGGLRCIYHGWKFDVGGSCLDQMNEPVQFKDKVRVTAYPTVEVGGVVWAYLGPAELQPPPPNFEWATVPATHRHVSKVIQECNWLQALEGGVDTSHAPILHRSINRNPGRSGISLDSPFVQGRAPTLEVDVTDYGYRYFGIRQLGEDKQYVRGYQFIMPFTQLRPQQILTQAQDGRPTGGMIGGHMWVPIDDENVMVYNMMLSLTDEPLTDEQRLERDLGNGPEDVDPVTFRARNGKWNDWGIDREMQRNVNFVGIRGVNPQDRAVQESMGPIIDRSREHLGPADKAIIALRQLLQQAVRTVQEGGAPLGANDSYYQVRAWEMILPREEDFRVALLPEMQPADAAREPALTGD